MEVAINFNNKADKIKLWDYLKNLNGIHVVTIEKKTRKDNWNRYYWGVVLKCIEQHTGYNRKEVHEEMGRMFNNNYQRDGRKNKEIIFAKSSKTLPQDQFEIYVEYIKAWAAESFHIYIPDIWEIYEA